MSKISRPLQFLTLIVAAIGTIPAHAVTVAEAIPANDIQVEASSAWGGDVVPANLINGAGLDEQFRHDNNANAVTMWHTAAAQKPSSPAPGLPAVAAWLHFTFKNPQSPDTLLIWNHNQSNLTDRGFRHLQVFATTDGSNWEKVTGDGGDTFEIPRASGTGALPASFAVRLPKRSLKGVILSAADNYGSNIYGLSAVRFISTQEVPVSSLPQPGQLAAASFPFVQDKDGNWARQVKVTAGGGPIYEAVDAVVECGGAVAKAHFDALSTGRSAFLVDLPPGSGAARSSQDKFRITLTSARWRRVLDSQIVPPAQWPNLEEVVITWKTHLDIGYTQHPVEVTNRYRTSMMDRALSLFDGSAHLPPSQRFIWMLPAWAMQIVLDDKQTPERRARLEQAVRDGRLIWHALPFTFEAEAMDAEEMARCLDYGVRSAKQFGMPLPEEAKLTDVPVQAWLVPTVLAHAGIKFLHIGCNGGSKPASVPTLFWWEGPDGSRVLTGYSTEYGWGPIPPADWKHKSWLAMIVTSDNSGPPNPENVQSILDQIKQQLPGVRARFGRPSDFADAILKENSEIPVVKKDMPDTWIHGMMSLPVSTGIHREAIALLPSLGLLDTELGAWDVTRPGDAADVLRRGYEQSAFYTEHTWGPSGGRMPGGFIYDVAEWKKREEQGIYVNFEAEFDYHANYAREAMATAQNGVTPRIKALADAVACQEPHVVAFNPLPWPRNAEVRMDLPPDANIPAAVRDLADGKLVPVSVENRVLRFAATNLPPGGYNTYQFVAGSPAKADELPAADTLETKNFKVRFDLQRGGIASLVDKATGRELVDAGNHTLGQILHQRFSSQDTEGFVYSYARFFSGWALNDFGKFGMPNPSVSPHWEATPGPWKISIKHDALGEQATLTCENTLGLAGGYTLTFAFPDERPCVDIHWEVKDKTPNPLPEGGWLCVPLAMHSAPVFRVGEDGGSINPATDIVVGGNRELLAADRAITVREGDTGAGAGVASADLPLWSLGAPGLWKYSADYIPTKPELFANLYNNMWNTNYPHWVGGSWKASIRIWPVASGASEEQAVFTPSWELRQEVLAAYSAGASPGTLPLEQNGLSVSRKGVRVTAFCPGEYNSGTLLRVWEQAGTGGELQVTLPAGTRFTRAQPVNLRGEKEGGAIAVEAGRFAFPLGAWAPASFVLN